jgi:hypothetical protein
MCLQGPLHLQHSGHARPRRGEHREKPIPLVIDFLAVMSSKPRPDQRVVAGQQLRVEAFSQPPDQGRRASMSVNKNVKVSTGTP